MTGLDYLMDALKEENRKGRGVMTGKSAMPPIYGLLTCSSIESYLRVS